MTLLLWQIKWLNSNSFVHCFHFHWSLHKFLKSHQPIITYSPMYIRDPFGRKVHLGSDSIQLTCALTLSRDFLFHLLLVWATSLHMNPELHDYGYGGYLGISVWKMTVWGKMLGKIQSLAKSGSHDEICQYETPGGPTGQLVSFLSFLNRLDSFGISVSSMPDYLFIVIWISVFDEILPLWPHL